MKVAAPPALPSGRVLAAWWRQLAPLAPRSLAVGQILLHHVEALVVSAHTAPPDPFAALVFRALALSPPPTLADLEGRLHLGLQVLTRILGDLAAAGRAEVDAAGLWHPGRDEPYRPAYQRRDFYFRGGPRPQFVPLHAPPAQPIAPPEGWGFDPAVLRACVEQSPQWKHDRGFPPDVRAVLTPESSADEPGEPPAWRRVVVDRPERVTLLLAVVPGEGESSQLRGFAVEPRGWLLHSTRPTLTMSAGWPEAFPELAETPAPEAWRGSWRAWCQGRRVPAAEADRCTLSADGVRLRVEAPRPVIERLHSANGAAPHDEVWLLGGEGMLRAAARVELVV